MEKVISVVLAVVLVGSVTMRKTRPCTPVTVVSGEITRAPKMSGPRQGSTGE